MGTKKPWWQPPLFFPVIKAQISIKHVATLSVEELKKHLINGLNRSGWAADNGALIPSVKNATSLTDIRNIFSPKICSVPKW